MTIELPPFDLATSTAHLRRYRPDATDDDAAVFHEKTAGNPRSQFYPLTGGDVGSVDMATLLKRCERTPEPEFAKIVDSALQVSGADAKGQRLLALLVALARPVNLDTLAVAFGVAPATARAFAVGLVPGVRIDGQAVEFRDDEFEVYVRGRVDAADVAAAHGRLADVLLASRATDPDAAVHVANHLFKARRLDEVVRLVLTEDLPVGIADGFRRQQVQFRRLDLAARAAAHIDDPVAAVRLAVRGCDTASRLDTLSQLVDSHLDLVARFTDVDLLEEHVLGAKPHEWQGPAWMRVAAALSRHSDRHDAARQALDNAQSWIHRWASGREDETLHWDLTADDVARAAEARYRLDGTQAATDEIRHWRPATAALEAAARLAERIADELSPVQVRDVLRDSGVPAAAQAPILAHLAAAHGAADPIWVAEVTTALLAVPLEEPASWHVHMIDTAVRFGSRDNAIVLARHWTAELPRSWWEFARADAQGTVMLRFHAAVAAWTGTDLPIAELVPASLRPRQSTQRQDDLHRDHDVREWLERVEPLLEVLLLTARAIAGDASSDDVLTLVEHGLARRADHADRRWFTFDSSYRAWATLVAETAVETGCVDDCLTRLVEAAPRLIRDAAPDLWLDLAELLARHRDYADRAADLCAQASRHVRTNVYSTADRLETLARAAEISAPLDTDLGRQLFDYAVDAATGISDDAARLLTVHADLTHRAVLPQDQRAATAARLIAAAEAVAPHVTESSVIPYIKIAEAAARLDPATGLAAASRWDDQDRVRLGLTLPAALTGAVNGGGVPPWQALALDHLIDSDSRRLTYQLDMAKHMGTLGNVGKTDARAAITRAARWLRCRVPGRDQPALARRLLDTADLTSLDRIQRADLETVAQYANDPDASQLDTTRPPSSDPSPAAQDLLANARTRTRATLAKDVAILRASHLYGDELAAFIIAVARAAPAAQRVATLDAVASLEDAFADTIFTVLADRVDAWRDWPQVRAWAAAALPALLAAHLSSLMMWHLDADTLVRRLRMLADDRTVRQAVLLAVPEARAKLNSFGWQNLAVLLGRLCGTEHAAEALLTLLDERSVETVLRVPDPGPAGALPSLLWSIFGHPVRELRSRAAHATRDLLTGRSHYLVAPLVAEFIRSLDHTDPGPFRDERLHFYAPSAAVGLLVALHQVAAVEPASFAPHFDDLLRHATNRDLPHAQIRELARRTALAVADPISSTSDVLRHANQPSSCSTDRSAHHEGSDRRVSASRRYDFDELDTLPYWFGPLARVFDVPVDTVAEFAEDWIVDRERLGQEDWYADARELRDERNWERTTHRQGALPPEESLRLYLEYHAMMVAAGQLVDSGRPVCIRSWEPDDSDPWQRWLSNRLPSLDVWPADLASAVPAEPAFLGKQPSGDATWDVPVVDDYDHALEISNDHLPSMILVAASVDLHHPGKNKTIYVRSALVGPAHADDLQRALAAASEPRDWKLPDEGEAEHEVDYGLFQLHGWLSEPENHTTDVDGHDPYARGLSKTLPLPGSAFRTATRSIPDTKGLALITNDRSVIAQGEQWADRDPGREYDRVTTSSGYRVRVAREPLLRYLRETNNWLILEVQIARRREGQYPPPRSRVYLIDPEGRITAR
ncbi:hypothetical protein BCD48_17525 [Pseudofrankia sp. BMG5.36]|nr:hypothetical protein BCD48_17525 [Pseudofrankia sp. BMG5.36]